MARVKIDFSEVESFAAIPEGEYPVVVAEVEVRDGQDYPYLNWKLEVSEGEFKGRFLWMITSLSPKSLWRLKEVCENLGVEDEEFELEVDEDSNMVLSPEFVGLPGIAPVTIEQYQNKDQNRVDGLLSADGITTPKKKTTARKPTTTRKTAAKPRTARKPAASARKFK